MIRAYFDSGTSNTRIYILRDNCLTDSASRAIGSRDSALSGDRRILVRALKEMYDGILNRNGLTDSDIGEIWASGMISCPSGMVEIEHVPVPADCALLARETVEYEEKQYFHRKIKVIPGLKTIGRGIKAPLDRVSEVNNVRGEEVEVFGVLRQYPELRRGHAVVVLPGSHTQVLFLENGVIYNILSNVTGELYSAVCKQSIIGASVEGQEKTSIDSAQVLKGIRNVEKYGFNRALYIVRAMELFADSTLTQRRSYLEGVLNAGVMRGISAITKEMPVSVIVAGSKEQYEVFSAIGEDYPQDTILFIEKKEQEPFSVAGMMSLAEYSPCNVNR